MQSRSGHWLLSCVFLLLLKPSAAGSQELSLDEAIRIAVEHAPQSVAQQSKLESAETVAVSAGRLPDPELILGIDNLPVAGADAWSTDRDSMTMRKVGLMQAFPNGRKREAQRERAAALVSVAANEAHESALDVSRQTGFAWVSVYAADLVVKRLHDLLPELELQATTSRTALGAGRGSVVDALAAQGEVSELRDRLLQAEREASIARAELARWIGEDSRRPLGPMEGFDVLPAPPEHLLSSLHRHASLRTFDAQRALTESEIDLARAEKRPDWSAELSYGDRGSAFSDMVSIEFRVGLPVFGRNRQDPVISSKRAELAQVNAEREAELRMHAAEVSSALAAWHAAQRRVVLYQEERLPLATQRTQAALAAFRSGQTDLSVVLASRVAEIEAQQTYATLVEERGQAWVYLRYLEAPGGEE